jgi:hypothetical protein
MQKAVYVKEIVVIDPDTNLPVEVAIYKDLDCGGMFGVDRSYIITLSDDDPVSSPFNGKDIMLME